jgi:hypothetical protein
MTSFLCKCGCNKLYNMYPDRILYNCNICKFHYYCYTNIKPECLNCGSFCEICKKYTLLNNSIITNNKFYCNNCYKNNILNSYNK